MKSTVVTLACVFCMVVPLSQSAAGATWASSQAQSAGNSAASGVSIRITDSPYKADSTGAHDSTEAINRACAAALAEHGSVLISSGTFTHQDLITCSVPMIGDGDASELRSTGEAQSSISSVHGGSAGYMTENGVPTTSSCHGSGMTLNLVAHQGIVTNATIASQGSGYSDKCMVYPDQRGGRRDAYVVLGVTPHLAVVLTGTGPQLRNIKLTTAWKNGRVDHTAADAVLIKADHWLVDQVHVVQSGSMGIQGLGAKNGTVQNSTVENTNADGIDFSGCSSFDAATGNTIINSGDDSLSINSYSSDACATSDITFTGNVAKNSQAHGLAIAGGANITATNTNVDGAKQPCLQVYSASTAYNGVSPVRNVTIDGFKASNCTAIIVYGETQDHNVDRVAIHGFVGTNLKGPGVNVYHRKAAGTFVSGLSITASSFSASPAAAGNNHGAVVSGAKNIELNQVTFTGFSGYCVAVAPDGSNAGEFRMVQSNCIGNNTGNASPHALHMVGPSGFSNVTVTGNQVKNGAHPLNQFANFGTERARITFNGNRGDVQSKSGGSDH